MTRDIAQATLNLSCVILNEQFSETSRSLISYLTRYFIPRGQGCSSVLVDPTQHHSPSTLSWDAFERRGSNGQPRCFSALSFHGFHSVYFQARCPTWCINARQEEGIVTNTHIVKMFSRVILRFILSVAVVVTCQVLNTKSLVLGLTVATSNPGSEFSNVSV